MAELNNSMRYCNVVTAPNRTETLYNVFGYANGDVDDSNMYGPFISFGNNEDYQCQIKMNFEGNRVIARIVHNGVASGWKEL